jgi:hypothetical protein
LIIRYTPNDDPSMADSLYSSFEGLSVGRFGPPSHTQQQNAPLQDNRASQLSVNSNSNGTTSSQGSSSLRTPNSSFASSAAQSNALANDGQSAAARFERFFKSTSPIPHHVELSTAGGSTADQMNMPYGQVASSSIGPGSSAAGLASSGAFGSFGQHIGTGMAGGVGGGAANAFGHNSTVPALRPKPAGSRQGIPSQWNAQVGSGDDINAGSQNFFFPGGTSPSSYSTVAAGGMSLGGAQPVSPMADEDIIPTAIVVKNIPFSIKREQLLQIIEDLQIPMPYAFNYHFDQGMFRGLAFANFRSGEEADAVVAALNGFDVSGRKLRVEYKKVLQAGEKERIEKEKAIKRMQSMQMEKERLRRHQGAGEDWSTGYNGTAPPMPANGSNGAAFAGVRSPDTFAQDLVADTLIGAGDVGNEGLRATGDSQGDLVSSAGANDVGGRKEELDLNDPATLEIYSRVLLFKDDRMRDELSFSRNLTTNERRIVHMVSKKLNLYHYSLGEGEERYVIVTKKEVAQAQRPLRTQASTIGYSTRTLDGGSAANLLAPGSSYTMGRSALRTKKSAPDMKRQRERSEDGAFSGNTFGAPGSGSGGVYGTYSAGLSRKSNGNLREDYTSNGRRVIQSSGGGAAGLQNLFSSPFDVPPVPSLPVQSSSDGLLTAPSPSPIGTQSNNNSLSAATASQYVLRQPAGPGAANRNFAQRSRVPFAAGAPANGAVGDRTTTGASSGPFGSANGFAGDSSPSKERSGSGLGDLRDDEVQSHQPLEV